MWIYETYLEDTICIKILKQIWKKICQKLLVYTQRNFYVLSESLLKLQKKLNKLLNKSLDTMEKIHIHVYNGSTKWWVKNI